MAKTLVVTASPSTTYGFEGPHEQQPLATHLWTQEDVQVWLFESGVGDCASYFAAKKVDGRALLKLRPVDLGAELGLKDEEAQLRVCAAASARPGAALTTGRPARALGACASSQHDDARRFARGAATARRTCAAVDALVDGHD
jgi:hypothetical protein